MMDGVACENSRFEQTGPADISSFSLSDGNFFPADKRSRSAAKYARTGEEETFP